MKTKQKKGKSVKIPTGFYRTHCPTGWWGSFQFVVAFFHEITANFFRIIKLRKALKSRKNKNYSNLTVIWTGDNLDEVNGIAINSRQMVSTFRQMGKDLYLLGVAMHNKQPRYEGVDDCIYMAPGRISMNQPGYSGSETALPQINAFLQFFRQHPPDVIEIQTPGAVAFVASILAKMLGIPILHHYRTDIPTYAGLLIKSFWGVKALQYWTVFFTRVAGPVIVPSNAYKKIVCENMGVPEKRVFKLPRGVNSILFHPNKKQNGTWQKLGLPSDGIRLLYVGRVSREKNLEILVREFPRLEKFFPDLNLTIVGEGPYLEEMKQIYRKNKRVYFTGTLKGEELAGVYASADLFVFPSLTDTFGNTVIEALASGVPCITSDKGGPQEIIIPGKCGEVFPSGEKNGFHNTLVKMLSNTDQLRNMKEAARKRGSEFTFEKSASAFWDFYCSFLKLM